MNLKNLKKIRLIMFILTLIIFITIMFFRINNNTKQYNNNNTELQNSIYKQTEYIYYNKLNMLKKTLINRLSCIINQKSIKNAIKNKDRETLYDFSIKRFNNIKKDFPTLNIMHYHLPDNSSLLRVHKKDIFGDNLKDKRPMIAQAIKTKSIQAGFEFGLYDKKAIAYRVAVPLIENNKLICVVELGIDIKNLLSHFDNFFKSSNSRDVYVGFLLNNDFKHNQKHIVKEHTVICNKPYINKIIKKITTKSFSQYIEIDNKTYFVFWNKQNMENFNNTKIGTLIYAFEVTELKDKFYHNIILSILQPIIGIAIFIFILNWLFNYIITQHRIYRKEIDKIITKNRQKDQQMMHQSRLAQMGEMISMIAHQWRQPLTAISATSANINLKTKLHKLDANTALELSDRISRYSQHLSTTIDDFRDFFKHNKEKKDTNYTEVIKGVLNIIETSIINQNITLIQNLTSTDTLHTYPNELKQVILNLIKNAEDVLVESNIPNPTITIETKDKILTISDNAGGVPEDIIDKIFDPYFSTKTKKNGTGLGLYMSKTIIEEHCNGKLYVSNNNIVNQDGSTSYGAVFNINLEKANDD